MLLLMLGTATAWADKYYMPKSYRDKVNPRLTLENAVGKRFMIYNTAIDTGTDENGNTIYGVDKTGFLRNRGSQFAHDKSKERDAFIYNESFVYTLEKHTDTDGTVWYAIKSLSTGTYVDCLGKTTHKNAADAKLNIYNWSEAKSKDIAAWTSMECWEYNIVANSDIEHQKVVFVIGGKATRNNQQLNAYWSGGTASFGTDEWLGHPYVFYEALEFTDESQAVVPADKPFLQDLYAYSRCDMYAAQRVYGLVHVHDHEDNQHITVPGRTEAAHGIHLCDGDILTSLDLADGEKLQFYLGSGKTTSAVHIHLQRNADKTNVPTKIKVEVSATGNDGDWETVESSPAVELAPYFTTDAIDFGGDYSYIRISNADGGAMSLSEAYIFPHENDGVLHSVFAYIEEIAALDNVIHTKAPAQDYADIVEEYNADYPAAKLLSGIPYPGNKYRIHADIYSGGEHGKLQLSASDNNTVLGGDYFTDGISAETRKAYEWYCEKLGDGSLAFKNVATGKYLALGAGTSDTPVGWFINSSLTQRMGVPLKNASLEYNNLYLTVYNNGSGFVTDNYEVKNQMGGDLSTDFVFMPVELTDDEKKITFKANELVMRNTELRYDADGDGTTEVYAMPFSRIFKENESLPKLVLQCPVLHYYVGVNNVSTDIADLQDGKVLTFNWDAIDNGDVLNIQLEIKEPFVVTENATAENKEPATHLYFIRNKRANGLKQQARPNRANIGIEGDGPISVVGSKFDYAKFDSRTTAMHLVQDYDYDYNAASTNVELDATSLFYFTPTEGIDEGEFYSVYVNNATTVKKFATNGQWDNNGGIWYVQPDYTGAYSGYNIGATKLNATNMPTDAWCDAEGADVISFATPDDDGTAWEFVQVKDDDAKKLLKEFIDKVATELLAKFSQISTEIATERGYDMEKVGYYKYMVEELKERSAGVYKDNIFKLVQYAQNIHMIEHEVVYALYELPLLSDEKSMDAAAGFANPKWYYVRNVAGNNYAAYTSNDHPMNLEQYAADEYPDGGKRLKNLFYFAGYKNVFDTDADNNPETTTGYKDYPGNNLILDEYLKIHLHNFMAERNTLVSRNDTVAKCNGYSKYNMQKITDITGGLSSSDNWTIEAEYLLDGSSFNAYGSCLMSSQEDALADYYPNAFQVYFKDNRTIVLKINDKYDTQIYNHTQEFYSKIKVVVTYSFGKLTFDIYNSIGEKKTWTGYVQLNPISALYSAFPANEGIKIENLVVKKVETMNWTEHSDTNNNDLWYIFPSSNLNNVGFAITLDGPNEYNQGWTNASNIVDTAPGYEDNSTWKFERVTHFDDHIDELLDMYKLKDCVIYNKELAALMRLINRNKALIEQDKDGGEDEEALFNEVYWAIINYNGPMPDELKAPKPGSLYTIRPAVEEGTQNALLVHVDDKNETYTTREVYVDDVVRDNDNSYDSRAAWVFEGTAGTDGFLPLTGLQVKNIHTQCYFTALGNDATTINENDPATVTLKPLGACTTMFQVGSSHMATSIGEVWYKKDGNFWGDAVIDRPDEITTITATLVNGSRTGNVHKKSWTVLVETEGNVTVTLTHNGGNHKLNILGVNLVDMKDNIVGDYRHTTAGGDPSTQTYTLNNVVPGTYTLNCYVWNYNGTGDNDDKVNKAQGTITFTGISQLAGTAKVTNGGNENTKWIIEEIMNPEESVYYSTSTNQNGHSTLMLGFPAQIPTEVEAFYASSHHNMIDGRYLRMVSYDEAVLPAKTPVVLRNRDYANNSTTINDIKFYYREDAVEALNGNYLYGSLYRTLVECASFNGTDVDGDKVPETDVNIYMLQTNKTDVKMYWVYENYNADGTKTGNNDDGGYVLCKANKAYMVLPSDKAGTTSSYSFRFDGNTTGIDEVEGENEELKGEGEEVESIYDLQGRKLTEISHPGVYIVNGKKIIVK